MAGMIPAMRVASLFVALLLTAAAAQAQTLTIRGCHRLPAKDFQGLSGITFAGENKFFGVLEWESQIVPMLITFAADGDVESFIPGPPVKVAGGKDLEGIAFLPGRAEKLLISDESPRIFEVNIADGKVVRTLPAPDVFKQIVPNYGFESLTYSVDGKSLWVANERALKIDGNPQTPATPISAVTRVRLQRYEIDGEKATPREQFEYETSGVHDWGGTIGLCDLAALPDGRLLALERSAAKNFSGQVSIRSRIFVIDTAGATDISKPPYDRGLVGQANVKVKKTLLWDGFVCDADGENLEGLCLGPRLGGADENRWAVVGVVDNTDGGLGVSKPSLISFELNLKARPAASAPAKGDTSVAPTKR
ncbi:MAG: hypothetical protein QOF78_4479 [Phycisphaerales bacterium]|nr:hypothetical protein [Phycisphaerales bacterium]